MPSMPRLRLVLLCAGCAIIQAIAHAIAAQGAVDDASRTGLRIPANTGYLSPDPGESRPARDGTVAPFAAKGTSLNWYGRFNASGALVASVELTAPAGDTLRLRLTSSAQQAPDAPPARSAPGEIAARADVVAIGTGRPMRVPFGAVRVAGPGYVRFALASQSARDESPAVRVAALLLDGAPLTGAHFNLDARRNAASVHLRYPVDTALVITGFYDEVTAVADPVNTYYMATGFARGYFGMQVNSPTERRIIFSVWDAGDGTNAKDRSTVAADDQVRLLGKGEGVVAEVFGNEGTGGHSHLVYDWKTGSTQRFFVTAAIDGTHTIYSGYWFHPDKQRWQLIASFRAPKDGQGLRRLYSFSENFGGSSGNIVRKALYGAQWVRLASGEWRELTTATFSHDATGKENRLDRWMGVENGQFFLQHGGFVDGFTASGASFTRPSSGKPPRIALP